MEHVEHDSMSVHTCTQSTSLRDDSSAQVHMIVGTHIFGGPKGGGRSPRGELECDVSFCLINSIHVVIGYNKLRVYSFLPSV